MNPVGIVEAPKTAIICTIYFGLPGNPSNILWLAAYNKSSLSLKKFRALNGRNVRTRMPLMTGQARHKN